MPKAKAEIRSLARSHTESAIKALSGIMSSKKAPVAARVAAAVALLDRGWGRPTQMIAGDPDGAPVKVDREEISEFEVARQIALILDRNDPKKRKESRCR